MERRLVFCELFVKTLRGNWSQPKQMSRHYDTMPVTVIVLGQLALEEFVE